MEIKQSYVWLTEKISHGSAGSEVYGIFSDPERGKQSCQDAADEYFGKHNSVPLQWLGDDGYRSAWYQHPLGASFLFQITRFEVDKVSEDRS